MRQYKHHGSAPHLKHGMCSVFIAAHNAMTYTSFFYDGMYELQLPSGSVALCMCTLDWRSRDVLEDRLKTKSLRSINVTLVIAKPFVPWDISLVFDLCLCCWTMSVPCLGYFCLPWFWLLPAFWFTSKVSLWCSCLPCLWTRLTLSTRLHFWTLAAWAHILKDISVFGSLPPCACIQPHMPINITISSY